MALKPPPWGLAGGFGGIADEDTMQIYLEQHGSSIKDELGPISRKHR